MRMRYLTAVAVALALSGCPERKVASNEPAPANAPLNLDKPEQARIELDLAAARNAIKQQQQIEGKTPASLDQLGVKLFHPDDLEYDASTGTVKSRTYPNL